MQFRLSLAEPALVKARLSFAKLRSLFRNLNFPRLCSQNKSQLTPLSCTIFTTFYKLLNSDWLRLTHQHHLECFVKYFLNNMKYFIGFASYLCFIFTFVLTADSNGFSENVLWTEYESAIEDKSKPSIIILHKAWCPACKNLKPKLADR